MAPSITHTPSPGPIGRYTEGMLLPLTAVSVALALPFPEPDLSFKETVLIPPRCTPGTSATWEIEETVKAQTRGQHINTGEDVDTDTDRTSRWRIHIACTADAPATLAVQYLFPEPGGTWSAPAFTLTVRLEDWNTPVTESVEAASPEAHSNGTAWGMKGNLMRSLVWIFPPMAEDRPAEGAAWDGPWAVEMGPWWDCHGRVTAGAREDTARAYRLAGSCESISYRGANRLSGTFRREDGGFGVTTAAWETTSMWEHYMIYTDVKTTVTVTRLP